MKVLVIGETCVDEFIYGRCEKISPEAPVPVFVPELNVEASGGKFLGMASNVFKNLMMLDVEVDIITNQEKPMPIKIRYVDEVSNQMLLRVDRNDVVHPITENQFTSIDYDKYDAIVISDYDKGFLSYEDIMHIAERHELVFLDSKKELQHWCDDIKFIKVNMKEFERSQHYLNQYYPHNLIVTLGSNGALYHNKNMYIKPQKRVQVRDVAGAGDTFFAAFVANYLKNNDICDAIHFANKCASWVVTQRGVVPINLTKLEDGKNKNTCSCGS